MHIFTQAWFVKSLDISSCGVRKDLNTSRTRDLAISVLASILAPYQKSFLNFFTSTTFHFPLSTKYLLKCAQNGVA